MARLGPLVIKGLGWTKVAILAEMPNNGQKGHTVESHHNSAMSALEDKVLLAEIAHKSDVAARNRRLRKYGFEAVDVYAEVTMLIAGRLAQGQTMESIVGEALAGRNTPNSDLSAPEARSLAIGRLCANAAERIIYRTRMERPVGDATAVVGEEVQTEQKELSEEEAANGNDRQMKAVLARKAMHRGIHRADVYGVADFSRSAMKDNSTRLFAERDEALITALFDTNWTPPTERQQEAWIVAFQGESPADVLYGLNRNLEDIARNLRGMLLMRTFGLNPSVDDGTVKRVYPTGYPYKPLKLATTRTERPIPASRSDKEICLHCAHLDPNGPFQATWRKVHTLAEMQRKAADPTYVMQAYKPLVSGIKCPPGKVLNWRGLHVSSLLPDSVTDVTRFTLRRALENFAYFIRDERNRLYRVEADHMVYKARIRALAEDRYGVGTGTPTAQPVTKLPERANRPYVNIWPEEDASGKEARRFALPLFGQSGARYTNLTNLSVREAFTIDLENPIPGTLHTPPLPGTKRLNETHQDMLHGPIMVSETGDMFIDGIKGTFVFGLRGLHEWNQNVRNGRKVVKALIGMKGYLLLGLAG